MPGRPAPVEMPADAVPESRRALGVVTLSVSGETVYFGNKTVEATVGDEHFAIVIAEPEALKNLVDELGQLPLEEVDAIELLPYRGTGWRGIFALPDGRTAQLILERTEP